MDITCPQCKTEYEFDDSKISESGVTVKCTNCNYMFKVRRKAVVEMEPVAPAAPEPAASEPSTKRPWMIRTSDGETYNFHELTTLQQWIVERKVTRDDQISRSGETWKSLGDISELSSFFQVVDAASAAAEQPATPVARAPAPTPAPPPPPSQPVHPASSYPAEPLMDDGQDPIDAALAEPAWEDATASQFQVQGQSAAWEDGDEALQEFDEDDYWQDDELPSRSPAKKVFVLVLVLALLGGLGFGAWKMGYIPLGDKEPDPSYVAGRNLFLMDDEDSLKQALQKLAMVPDNGLALAARAEVCTTLAQQMRDEAALLDRRAERIKSRVVAPPDGGEPRAVSGENPKELQTKAQGLREDFNKMLKQAEKNFNAAIKAAPKTLEVKRAMADYYRLLGRGEKVVMPPIKGARALKADDPELYYVEGAFWFQQGKTRKAEDLLKAAIEKAEKSKLKHLHRASFQLAMLYLQKGQRDGASQQVENILRVNPKHRLAQELKKVLAAEEATATAAAPPAAPDTPAKKDAPEPAAPHTPATPAKVDEPKTPDTPTKQAGRKPGASLSLKGSYADLVRRGNKLSERGKTMKALKVFNAALKKNPTGHQALSGVGYCHLDQERTGSAIRFFKKALRQSQFHGDSMIGMAEAYKVQGNHRKALNYYKAFLRTNPSGKKASMARRSAAALEAKLGVPPPVTKPSPAPAPPPVTRPAPAPAPPPKATPPPPPAIRPPPSIPPPPAPGG